MLKKILISVFIVLISTILVIGGSIFIFFHNEKKQKSNEINNFLIENNLQELVKEKEIVYDSKLGVYCADIVFIDEPNNRYEIYIHGNNADVTAYDQNNWQITDKNKAKYIN